jgi:hypothetical protein
MLIVILRRNLKYGVDKMNCPHCAEEINQGATKCPYCTGSITYGETSLQNFQFFRYSLILCAIVGFLLGLWLADDFVGALWWGVKGGVFIGPLFWLSSAFGANKG